MRKIFLLLFIVSNVFAIDLDDKHITSKKLDNGLSIYVIEDKRAPLSWFQIWYNVGSSDEDSGMTGISHALEHMMFKGTPKYPSGKIVGIVDENGGSQNAFTSRDYTCYWQKFPTNKLELSFEIESDRMQNLVLQEKDFIAEKAVILEERRMRTDDNPNSLAYEQFMATLAVATPYQNPVIGWQRDIKNITVSDMREWYKTWYSPNNATIVVAGDVVPSEVFKLAEKYFGNISPSILPEVKNMKPVPQLGKKDITVKANAKVPSVAMGIQVPSLVSVDPSQKNDIYALVLLNEIIGGGRNSLLEKDLVRKQEIATAAGSSYSPFAKYSIDFYLYAVPSKGNTTAKLEKALFKLLDSMKENPISTQELSKAKTRLITHEVYSKESPENRATDLGAMLSIGLSWSDYTEFFASLQKVTPEDITAVVKKYFTPDNFVVVNLLPNS